MTLLLNLAASAQQAALGIFEGQTDIGDVKIPGGLTYDAATQQYTVSGAGNNGRSNTMTRIPLRSRNSETRGGTWPSHPSASRLGAPSRP